MQGAQERAESLQRHSQADKSETDSKCSGVPHGKKQDCKRVVARDRMGGVDPAEGSAGDSRLEPTSSSFPVEKEGRRDREREANAPLGGSQQSERS